MEAKEILTKVKQLFNDLVAPVSAAVPTDVPVEGPKEYELKVGGMVMIDKLEVGGVVMIDGASALPGSLELIDGTMITVGDNGAITEIMLHLPEEVLPAVEDMGVKFTAFETLTNDKFANYETKFAAQELQLSEMKISLAKATSVIEKLLELSTIIVEAPAAVSDVATRTQNTFKDEQKKYSSILFN